MTCTRQSHAHPDPLPPQLVGDVSLAGGDWVRHSPRPWPQGIGLAQDFGDRVLMMQPRHALVGGTLQAAEAFFSRMHLPPYQRASADREVSAELSSWLLEIACLEAEYWNAAPAGWAGGLGARLCYAPSVMLSVDMPAAALREGRLLADAKSALARSGLSPFLLEIELPESAVMDDAADLLLDLSALRDLGVGLALDHFGSVSASLRLLQRLPLTAVKLDPCLIRGVVHDREARATVAATISLAHAVNTTVVATGVETTLQRDILADMGCDEAQGDMFGGPVEATYFRTAITKPVRAETYPT